METKERVAVEEMKENKDEKDMNDKEEDEKEMVMDLEALREGFTPGPNGEVPLESYVNAYGEMNNFFKVLGSLFQFVANDVNRKVAQLRAMLTGETSQHYVDVKTMLDYEMDKGLIQRSSSPSGAKTFLQLHRAQEFTSAFMKELVKEEEEPSLGQVSSALYKATVGRFHPPILATPISGLLLLLPKRATILSRVAKGNTGLERKVKKLLSEVSNAIEDTYAASQTLYQDRKLLLLDSRQLLTDEAACNTRAQNEEHSEGS